MPLPINPETKVGALLDAYPGIEDVLIAWAPAFAKLKNPILRRTVAKVATLDQAARVGGVSVRDLVMKLREAAGQQGLEAPPACGEASEQAPEWLSTRQVRFRIDADSMLETGVHPIGKVRESVAALPAGEMVQLTSSFRPEPLLEAMRRSGLLVYCAEDAPGKHSTYITRP
jgi:uncharacterized protein (DUF1800 family)